MAKDKASNLTGFLYPNTEWQRMMYLLFDIKSHLLFATINAMKGEMSIPTFETRPDSLTYWMKRYQQLTVHPVRSEAVTRKIALHLERFLSYFKQTYGR